MLTKAERVMLQWWFRNNKIKCHAFYEQMPVSKQFVRMSLLLLFPSSDKSCKSPLLIAISKFTACLLHKISFKSVFWLTVSILLIRRLNSLCEHR